MPLTKAHPGSRLPGVPATAVGAPVKQEDKPVPKTKRKRLVLKKQNVKGATTRAEKNIHKPYYHEALPVITPGNITSETASTRPIPVRAPGGLQQNLRGSAPFCMSALQAAGDAIRYQRAWELLEAGEVAAQSWLEKDVVGQLAQEREEKQREMTEHMRDHYEALISGAGSANNDLEQNLLIDRQKESLLKSYPEKWMAYRKRRLWQEQANETKQHGRTVPRIGRAATWTRGQHGQPSIIPRVPVPACTNPMPKNIAPYKPLPKPPSTGRYYAKPTMAITQPTYPQHTAAVQQDAQTGKTVPFERRMQQNSVPTQAHELDTGVYDGSKAPASANVLRGAATNDTIGTTPLPSLGYNLQPQAATAPYTPYTNPIEANNRERNSRFVKLPYMPTPPKHVPIVQDQRSD